MGGFHGGHSGGHHGGFHGGSHHSYSHHSSGSYNRPRSVHVVRGGHHYINGRRYYGAYYGILNSTGKPQTFGSRIGFGVFFLILGLAIFAFLFRVSTKATVISASIVGNSWDKYEVYDFEYNIYGKSYFGYGDDDLNYDGSLSILKGEEYPIYVNPFSPASYSFDNTAPIAIIFLSIFGGIGLIIIGSAISVKRKHDKELAAVGDANGDGVIDDRDLEYADSLNKGASDGAYEGIKKAMSENKYQETKILRRCPYCDSIVDDEAKFCQQCGSNLR